MLRILLILLVQICFARGSEPATDIFIEKFEGSNFLVRESAVIAFSRPMDEAVLSWNIHTPGKSHAKFSVRFKNGERWSKWFEVADWGSGIESRSFGLQNDGYGSVNIDTVRAKQPSAFWQYRWELVPDSNRRPSVDSVVLAVRNRGDYRPSLKDPVRGVASLEVPALSQFIEGSSHSDSTFARRICSPTSVAMLLRFWKSSAATLEVAKRVYDAGAASADPPEPYGNWSFNVAAIFQMLVANETGRGFISYVRWFDSLDEVLDLVGRGAPVIVSLRYGEGELDGSFMPSPGHLVLVKGSDATNIFVNDPAAPETSLVTRRYRKDQFLKAWKGVAYVTERR